jgi:hypothetical protein
LTIGVIFLPSLQGQQVLSGVLLLLQVRLLFFLIPNPVITEHQASSLNIPLGVRCEFDLPTGPLAFI